jgi:acetylserotonin N-methyltransferase
MGMTTGALPPSTDDRAMWDIWESMFTLPLVTVADEVGTFAALSEQSLTTEELARKLGFDARALGLHLAGLGAMGLLDKRGGKWSASPEARRWLHPDGEGYWGGFLFGFRERTRMHEQLLETLQTGKRPENAVSGGPEWERGHMSDEAAQRIAAFMHAHSQAPARGAAQQPEFASVKHLMDVGCGSGVYGIEIARANPAMRVTLMDLEAMAAAAQTYVDKAGLADRIATAGVNMFEEAWPTHADAHFFANVFHDWSEETNRLIARKSFAALPSGGRIFLSEILMDDDLAGPWPAASFSLLMLVGTLGKQYSLPEFTEILESAGFTDVTARRHGGGYYSLVSATKP